MDKLHTLFAEAVKAQAYISKATKTIADKKLSIGNQLLALANESADLDAFLRDCDTIEAEYKAAKKGRTIPRAWTQAKSNIKAAIKLGIGTDYPSESSMRSALNAKRKANQETTAQANSDALKVMLAKVDQSFTDKAQRLTLASELEKLAIALLQQRPQATAKPARKAVKAA